MLSQYELVKKIKRYQANVDEKLVGAAYVFSKEAHKSQFRSSGEPYFIHPLGVANILADLKLDSNTIITALLHDTVEDTCATLDDIRKEFGDEVAFLVDGVTKLGQIEHRSPTQKSAENFRKLVIAMSRDIRVLLVKLADRLHNMRTIGYIENKEKRVRISEETLMIHANLAERIGMHQIKEELQDIAFEQTHPDVREYIVGKLADARTQEKDIIERVTVSLLSVVKEAGIKCSVFGREKKPYSIWQKMKKKNVLFSHLYDIMAFRIVVEGVDDCYRVLGCINSSYNMIPGTFKDYISTPKENGYQSIHTVVLGPENKKIEIQIRTREMHEVSEIGLAAHWKYKQDSSYNIEDEKYRWIRELMQMFEHSDGMDHELHNSRLQIHEDQVFCFTPAGDVFNLPNGATVIDFAYAIHSEVGDRCVGGKVNGRMVPLKTILENGDQVEIMTAKNARPSPSWKRFVVTPKAKSSIQHFIRQQKKDEYRELGKTMVSRHFSSRNLEVNTDLLKGVLDRFHRKDIDDLYAFIGEGLISVNEVLKALYPKYDGKSDDAHDDAEKANYVKKKSGYYTPIDGLPSGMLINFAKCCHPIPGDDIIGVINTGRGIAVHMKKCGNVKGFAKKSERFIEISWRSDKELDETVSYMGRIRVTSVNDQSVLNSITSAVVMYKGQLANLKVLNKSYDYMDIILDVDVKNVEHLLEIVAALKIQKKVIGVERVEY